jgi:hypothetical protein
MQGKDRCKRNVEPKEMTRIDYSCKAMAITLESYGSRMQLLET